MNIKKILIMTLASFFLIGSSGCLSYNVLEGSKKRVAIRKAINANNEFAIQALKRGESIHAAGIQVSTMEAAAERPVLLGAAAIGDGLIIWGGVEGVQYLADQADDSKSEGDEASAGRDSTNIDVNGNNNVVQVRGDSSTVGGEEAPVEE